MALNVKTLATRSLSALVFVVVLIGCVYWNYWSFSIFFFAIAMLGLNEFYKISEKMGAQPFKLTGFIFGTFLYLYFIRLDSDSQITGLILKLILSLLVICPIVILAFALFSKKENSVRNAFYTLGGILYAVLPFALLNELPFCDEKSCGEFFEPEVVLGIIFLIWSNDTFAYLGGSLLGKHKMIERVSPGKTWEGTIIGVIITFALSFSFDDLIYPMNFNLWPVFGIAIPILATIGDLAESKLKREAGIKDSGNIMPGHGGILDRFDSLIFVSPFVYALFLFLRS